MRTCTICGGGFEPTFTTMQIVCSLKCARKVPVVARKQARSERRDDKARLAVMVETLPILRKQAQAAFNAYIRARDAGKSCICCGRYPGDAGTLTGGEWDAGHYRSRGACPELAFDERNCHAQLKQCNRRSWDVAGYRAELIRRIGLPEVLALEGPHSPKHYTRDDLRAIRDHYRAKLKEIKR